MRVLLDTHSLVWFIIQDPRLSQFASRVIADMTNRVEVSPASIWEIAIKVSLGKFQLDEPFDPFFERQLDLNAFYLLPIEPKHAAVVAGLPFHHRDPFDRLLVAQALAEGVPIVSADAALDAYGVDRLW